MFCPRGGARTLGQFALVSYLPDPLACFLDRLRRDLTPDCNPRAHVTVLPPRPFSGELQKTIEELSEESRLFPPFEVELGDISVFPVTNVVYLSLKSGERNLHALQENLNAGQLEYDGPYPYHPHITIAQDFDPEQLNAILAAAREGWAKYTGSRWFTVECLSFVQNVAPQTWVDVAKIPLAQPIPVESAA
ncbi:MAG: 2'-5' RNA ligase family protein [Acidobacteriota bacterium]|nr:2'-5' RNA ligase family protein [Acidobacteriota bacterium]